MGVDAVCEEAVVDLLVVVDVDELSDPLSKLPEAISPPALLPDAVVVVTLSPILVPAPPVDEDPAVSVVAPGAVPVSPEPVAPVPLPPVPVTPVNVPPVTVPIVEASPFDIPSVPVPPVDVPPVPGPPVEVPPVGADAIKEAPDGVAALAKLGNAGGCTGTTVLVSCGVGVGVDGGFMSGGSSVTNPTTVPSGADMVFVPVT